MESRSGSKIRGRSRNLSEIINESGNKMELEVGQKIKLKVEISLK